ncbi:MAG: alpha-glucuronidase [Acidobacteriota bacterium]|mgnify:CR=1 FL=1|jgi:alpha-glucuronidase|nr:alpha-glucuronidase [Acidobacteriota bacterium]NLT33581.1 alpha-glucuronidase [Acidobacteriota bacterium]
MRAIIGALIVFNMVIMAPPVRGESGRELWLRAGGADPVHVVAAGDSAAIELARGELRRGWRGKAGATVTLALGAGAEVRGDGYRLTASGVTANTDLGLLYGVYDLLRRQRTGRPAGEGVSNPAYERRILNHWDNLDGSVERGYGGRSIFWRGGGAALAVTERDRELWAEYGRANASIGINGTVINNVNAAPEVLSDACLGRVQAIADVLRPYGIRVYLSVKFSSPAQLGKLPTSDPLDERVVAWWRERVAEVYRRIPDFGGLLVKANSEGQPGPQDFGRTHAEGANMLADALAPHGGIVMWRAFVYNPGDRDRARQAYAEFMPLDGRFRPNVIVQVKNGPVDFQPREPFNPLFGAMKKTAVMPELQITQEYLGHSIHLVFLGPMWEEFLRSDTYGAGPGSTVARATDGSLFGQEHSAIAGVANIGLDHNWCGHHFAQANWYAFGRLAWDHTLGSREIADEWLRLTFAPPGGNRAKRAQWEDEFLGPVRGMMLRSWEAAIDYMMPLGLHHIFAGVHHYGPGPWYAPEGMRPDWTPPYYHQADAGGIGFDRTRRGSDAVSQYAGPLAALFDDPETCPEMYLLWFHHLPWNHKMKSGRTLWDEIACRYQRGLDQVREFQKVWDRVEPYVDAERFAAVQSKLRRHCRDAQIWKDACLLYFQQFSRMPIPYELERPVQDLEELMKIELPWLHHN